MSVDAVSTVFSPVLECLRRKNRYLPVSVDVALSWHAAELVVLLICIRTLHPAHIWKTAHACAPVGEPVPGLMCVYISWCVCPPVRWMADGLFCVFSSLP